MDFSRFQSIFALAKSNSTPKLQKPKKSYQRISGSGKKKQNNESRLEKSFQLSVTKRRKCDYDDFSLFQATQVHRKDDQVHRQDDPVEDVLLVSTDKNDILPYLSCNIEEFGQCSAEPRVENANIESTSRGLCDITREIYSPQIDEFSDCEEFLPSQEGETTARINCTIAQIYQQKPKYKPMHKVPKPGGLMERLRIAKFKRLSEGCHFASTKDVTIDQRKIKVVEHFEFRRRLLLKFEFYDSLAEPLLEIDYHHYLVVPQDFKKFIGKQQFYDVVFDLPEREFMSNRFMHFGKLIKAGKQF